MALNIDELREKARRKLPTAVFDFIDGAAEDEVTLRRNREAFGRYALVPRVGVDVSSVALSTSLLGQEIAAPLVLAPTGLCGMATSRGEVPTARAAAQARIPCVVSCLSSVPLEEVVRDAPGEHWFQLYVWKDRGVTQSLVERAAASGYRVLVVTLDSASVKGDPLPGWIVDKMREQNLAKDLYDRPQNAGLIARLESIEVGDGRITIVPRLRR